MAGDASHPVPTSISLLNSLVAASAGGTAPALLELEGWNQNQQRAAFGKFVDWQIEEGVNFLVPCGTTGENPAMTQEEHARVVELAVKHANGRVPVLAGAGNNNTQKAIDLALIAIDLGAAGALTITPYYNKPTPDGLRRHFGMQAEAVIVS